MVLSKKQSAMAGILFGIMTLLEVCTGNYDRAFILAIFMWLFINI